jgi:hypothetical protein
MTNHVLSPEDYQRELMNAAHAFLSSTVAKELLFETYLQVALMLRVEGFEVTEPGNVQAETDTHTRAFYQQGRVADPATGCCWGLQSRVWICEREQDFGELGLTVRVDELSPTGLGTRGKWAQVLLSAPALTTLSAVPNEMVPLLTERLQAKLHWLSPYEFLRPKQIAGAEVQKGLRTLLSNLAASVVQ